MDPLANIADMNDAVHELLASRSAGARRFGERLADYAENANAGAALLECLGLASVNGESWWQTVARLQRDAALCQLAQFWPDKKIAGQAYEIERAAGRYAAAGWRFDKGRAEMPAHYIGTVSEHLWRAFKSGAEMPLKK